jgi:DNA primase
MHSGQRKSHKAIIPDSKPLWHGFYYALPQIYKIGVCVLVEGPKDALVLASAGIPAIAVLMAIPSPEHLRVIRRYAGTVLWIGDRDPVDGGRAEIRVSRAKRQARELELGFFDFKIPVKDPAELAGNQEWLEKIRDRVFELSSFSS